MLKTSLILPSVAVACGLLFTGAASAQAQSKVGIVDMNKVFAGYYKTKDAESKINEAREVAKKELDDRMESHKTMLNEINELNKKIDSPGFERGGQGRLGQEASTTRSPRCAIWSARSRSSRPAARSSSRSRPCACATRSSRRS